MDESTKAAELAEEQTCPAEELPPSLNTHRYLGGYGDKQKDFHYRQNYRVDHLWHNQAHKMSFTLKERSLLRIVAPVHKHLEFELVLNKELSQYHHKTIIIAKKEDYHSTIFAQLEPGDYSIKLNFVSDASLLQQPC